MEIGGTNPAVVLAAAACAAATVAACGSGGDSGATRRAGSGDVALRTVTKSTLEAVLNLRVAPEQAHFVASNAESIAEAYFDRETLVFWGIFAAETPVGFAMISTKADEEAPWARCVLRFPLKLPDFQ